MTFDLPDTIDFSGMEQFLSTDSDVIEFANSLPDTLDDAEMHELLRRASLTKPATLPTKFDTIASSERITIRLTSEVWKAYREAAARRGVGYQTLINDTLRQVMSGL